MHHIWHNITFKFRAWYFSRFSRSNCDVSVLYFFEELTNTDGSRRSNMVINWKRYSGRQSVAADVSRRIRHSRLLFVCSTLVCRTFLFFYLHGFYLHDFSALAYRKSRFTDPDRDTVIFKKSSWNDTVWLKLLSFSSQELIFSVVKNIFEISSTVNTYFLMLLVMSNLLISVNYYGRRSQAPRVYNTDTLRWNEKIE